VGWCCGKGCVPGAKPAAARPELLLWGCRGGSSGKVPA
jgi:hypothetical protein